MKVRRALISVSDKTGLLELATAVQAAGAEILSTGGTAAFLREAGIAVREVADYTASPEVMGGRVKTLHPRVHGGLLMRDLDEDREALEALGGGPIDLLCVNLYPFEATVAAGADLARAIENIDIGGPAMIRSAAKNHQRVSVLVDPQDYPEFISALASGGEVPQALRSRLAAKAFARTAAYDSAIAAYLHAQYEGDEALPERLTLSYRKRAELRYGENPHQVAALYVESGQSESLAQAEWLGPGGKEVSYNNLVDLDAALSAVREFQRPAAVVVKHANPCGVAEAESLEVAYRRARDADALSAFGGIVALNDCVDAALASTITETFIECLVAPEFSEEALEILASRKNLRVLRAPRRGLEGWQYKAIEGGILVQGSDRIDESEVRRGQVVTSRSPSESEWADLDFAWKVCKHVKSNAIVLARQGCTVGIGAGQMSRVVSVQIAVQKAGDASRGAAMASDAFFPFADGVEGAVAAGVSAIVHPGGSKRDVEVIAAAERAGIAMVCTGIRHFRH